MIFRCFGKEARIQISCRVVITRLGVSLAGLAMCSRSSSAVKTFRGKAKQNMNTQVNTFDVIIVGGGPAGLSAALTLGRSCRRVLVCDSGQPRNASSDAVHNFFSRDGIKPNELLLIGREQLRPYNGVQIWDNTVVDATKQGNQFEVVLDNGKRLFSRKLLLATGVVDEIPQIEGFKSLWGSSIFGCPYCHGWEVRGQPLAIYGKGEEELELALLLTGWSRDLVFCSDGPAELNAEARQQLNSCGIQLIEEKILLLKHEDGVLKEIVFINGDVLERRGIFLRPKLRYRKDLPKKLGCKLQKFGSVEVDEKGQTNIAGLYVAGDVSGRIHQAIGMAADGAYTAYAINHALVKEDLGSQGS